MIVVVVAVVERSTWVVIQDLYLAANVKSEIHKTEIN